MHAIDTAGSVNGRFSEGNPASGQRATRVGADWLNDLQGNLLALLTEGGVAPTKGRAADIVDAVKEIARAVGGGSGGSAGSVPNTRKVQGAGLLAGQGGDLSADRTFTLYRASAVEIAAGAVDDKVLTPKGLFDAMTANIGDHTATVGPLTFKTGRTTGTYFEGSVYIPFPQPFVTECWTAIPILRNDTGSDIRDVFAQLVGPPSKDGFTAYVQRVNTRNDAASGIDWFAVGV